MSRNPSYAVLPSRWVALCAAALLGVLSARGEFRYVSPSGSDANTGTNWAQAWGTISNAVTNATAGDTILVATGTYGVTAEIVVTKALSIIGQGTPGETIVERTGAQSNRIFKLLHPDILVANLTIRKGFLAMDGGNGGLSALSGGAGIFMTGGTVSNCVITTNMNDCLAGGGYPYGGGVAMGGGTLWGCTVSSNNLLGYGTYGHGVFMTNGIVRDCVIIDNHGRPGEQGAGGGLCMMRSNSLATNNYLARNGNNIGAGGIYFAAGTVVNCTMVSNALPGVLMTGGLTLKNCEIAFNGGANVRLRGNGNLVTNCLIYGGASTIGVEFYANNPANSISANNRIVDCVISNQGGLGVSSPGVGLSVTNNQVLNGAIYNAGFSIGNAAQANINQGLVTGSQTIWNLTGKPLTVGFAGATGNVMTVTDSGTVANVGSLSVMGVLNSLVVSNGASITGTNASIGAAGSYSNWLAVDNASVSIMGLTIGTASSSNSVTIKNNSVWDLRNGLLTLGSGKATNNTLTVDNTSYMTNAGGFSLNDAGRTVTLANGAVDGLNIQFSGGALIAGNGPTLAPVALVMSNYTLNPAGSTNGGPSSVGLTGSSSNTISILQGALWNGGNQAFTLGNGAGATGNLLRIDGMGMEGGAVVTNMNAISIGSGSSWNSLIVTNGGRLFSTATPVIGGGNPSSNNLVLIIGGGPGGARAKWDLGNAPFLYLGSTFAASSFNDLIVDGAGVTGGAELTNLVELLLGAGNVGQRDNRVTIRNGGLFTASKATLGFQAVTNTLSVSVYGGSATSRLALASMLSVQNTCALLVDGAGVDGSAIVTAGGNVAATYSSGITVTNQGRLLAASLTVSTGHSNRLVIAAGGKVYSTGAGAVGNVAGWKSNSASVRGSGSLLDMGNQALTVGIATSTNSTLTIDQDGAVDTVGTLTVAGALNAVNLLGGTLGVANTTYTNGLFTAGDGSQAAALKALGGTLTFSSGLLVSSNAVLTGIGTVSGASSVVLTNGGAINPGLNGAGALTIGGTNLIWNPGGIYSCEITNMNLGPGYGWDLVTVSSQLVANGSGLVIRMDSMGGQAAGFEPDGNYSIRVLSFGAQSGFAADAVTVDTNAFPGGTVPWTVTNMNNSLYLQYRGAGETAASSKWNDPNSGNWDVSGNWTPGGQPANDGSAALEFSGGPTPYAATNNLGEFMLNKLILSGVGGAGVTNTIAGNTLVFTNSGAGVDYSGSGSYTVTNNVLLAGETIFGGLGGGGTLLMAGNIAGGQPLVKEGPWTLALKGSNTFADPVIVDNGGGVVRLDHANAFSTNSFVVSNGTLQSTVAITLGGRSTFRNARITGPGTLWTNGAALTISSNAQLTVDTGARLAVPNSFSINNSSALPYGLILTNSGLLIYSNVSVIGSGSSSNTLLITGPGSMLYGPGDAGGVNYVTVGGANQGNVLKIENGGVFTNARLLAYGANAVVVTNGGRLFPTTFSANDTAKLSVFGGDGVTSLVNASLPINMNGSGGEIVVDGGNVDGSAVMIGAGMNVGQTANKHNNRVRVFNKGRLTAFGGSSTLGIGVGSTNNIVEVYDGGYAQFAAGSGYFGLGNANRGNDNAMIVRGTNSVLELPNKGYRWEIGFNNNAVSTNSGNKIHVRDGGMLTNAAIISIASFVNGMNSFGNGILVTTTGRVYSSAGCEVGLVAGVTGNYLKVTDTGSVWNLGGQTNMIGHANGWSTNNYLMITQGGTMDNVGNLVIRSNNMVYLHGGTLGLIRAGITNGQVLTVGDGTQPATLKALGGALSFASGLVVTNNGTLTGLGIVQAETTVYGAVSPGIAIGTLSNNGAFVLKPGANTAIELAAYTTPGAGWDHLAVTNGALVLDGTLTVLLTGGFVPTNTQSFVIMTNLGPSSVSGSFASGSTVPAYTNVGGKAVGAFRVAVGTQGVVLDSFAPFRGNPGSIIFIR